METPPAPLRTTAIRLGGRDALPLLNRVSTNALLDLAPGQARPTLFCDFRGRLLHRAVVYRARDESVWLLRDDAPGAELAAFVDRFVFREDVALEDRSEALVVTRAPAGAPGTTEETGGVPTRVALEAGMLWIGATPTVADERARIAAGRPGHRHEIVEEFNPFEVGLGDEVHLDKGCYTGQEALQRLTTYGSVRRRLARVAGVGSPPAPPADLTWNGEPVGRLTSVAPDGEGGWKGLAVIRIDCLESGRTPSVGGTALVGPPEPLESPRALGRP